MNPALYPPIYTSPDITIDLPIVTSIVIGLSVAFIIAGGWSIATKLMDHKKTSFVPPALSLVAGFVLMFFGMNSYLDYKENEQAPALEQEQSAPELESEPESKPEPESTHTNIDMNQISNILFAGLILTSLTLGTINLINRNRHNKQAHAELQERFKLQRERLSDVMAKFTAATLDPSAVTRYPLYRASEHPLNRNFVDTMMNAYAEEAALEARIASSTPRDAEDINLRHFTELVNNTEHFWEELDYEAKRIGSPLLPLDLEERAQKLLVLATDETSYTAEREQAMNRLITLLTDARSQLRGDNAMLVDAMLTTVTDAKRAGNMLTAPEHIRELTASYPELVSTYPPAIEA